MEKQRSSNKLPILLGMLLLAMLTALPAWHNPFEVVISQVAESKGWDADRLQMLHGRYSGVSFLIWTKVVMVAVPEPQGEPIYLVARRLPFLKPSISCYSVGQPGPCV